MLPLTWVRALFARAGHWALGLPLWPLRKLRDDFTVAIKSRYYPLGYTPALDGLRGLMAVGVVVEHVRENTIPGAFCYMDIFFVMSAYFITSLLLRDIERFGRIRYGEFYRRRFSRILPAFIVMVSVYLLCRAIVPAGPSFSDAIIETVVAMAYFTNWWYMYMPDTTSFLPHTWSLSVEEQFYLVWPASIALLVRFVGIDRRAIVLLALAAVVAWAWRAWMTFTGASWERLYLGTDTHADAFLMGAALAIWLKLAPAGSMPRLERLLPHLAWPLLIYGIAVSFLYPVHRYFFQFYLGVTLFGALPGTLLVLLLVRSNGTILHKFLELPPAIFLGEIFYGLYLWHFPIIKSLENADMNWRGRLAIGLPLSIVLAALSYIYIEKPFMRRRPRKASRGEMPPVRFVGSPQAMRGIGE